MQRENVWDGTVHKCPHCGETLRSFTTVCPACGRELRDVKATSSVSEFSARIETRLRNRDAACYDDVIAMIKGYVIPNTKEDILEFVILSSSNVDFDVYAGQEGNPEIAARRAVSDAWVTQLKQAYQKAGLVFGSEPEYEKVQTVYSETMEHLKKAEPSRYAKLDKNSKGFVRKIMVALIAVLVIAAAFVAVKCSSGIERAQTKAQEDREQEQLDQRQSQEQERLESIVAEIKADIDNEDFDSARYKAAGLVYSEDLSASKHAEWEQRKQEILEIIDDAEGLGIGRWFSERWADITSAFGGDDAADTSDADSSSGVAGSASQEESSKDDGWLSQAWTTVKGVFGGNSQDADAR